LVTCSPKAARFAMNERTCHFVDPTKPLSRAGRFELKGAQPSDSSQQNHGKQSTRALQVGF
jgi:hypothetical protein